MFGMDSEFGFPEDGKYILRKENVAYVFNGSLSEWDRAEKNKLKV